MPLKRPLAVALVRMMVLSVVGVGMLFGTGVALAQSNGEIDSCTTITENGAYELTEDIENSEQKYCIKIEAERVELNGNGHLIDGVGEDNTVGVYVPDANGAVEIYNLEVTNWDEGIRADNTNGEIIVEDVIAHHNKDGVKSFAIDLRLRDSEIYNNSDDGIHASADSGSIYNNTVYANEEDGMYLPVFEDGGVSSNVVRNNGDDGLYLRHIGQTDFRVIVEGNTIKRNADDGIHLNDVERVTIRDNTICDNEDNAIYVADTPDGEVTKRNNDLSC